MKALSGWRIGKDGEGFKVAFVAGDITVVEILGLTSRFEGMCFIAIYLVFMVSSRESEAEKMLREFTSRIGQKPS